MSHEDGPGPQMSPSSASMTSERRRRQQELNHDTEIIFVLPSLQMNFKTIHQQGVEEPREGDPKPLVECSFVTEFEDHTYITMDAESILFIHDLVTSYLREKDKDGSESSLKSPSCAVESPTEVLKQDYREYQCHTWHLEPTIRLISWGGKKIDPVGVDYILQKLGFQHARLTIPKWIQRGFMDPLDGILSVLVKQLIKSLKEEQTQSIDGQESDIM
ncbi:hypothetical protein LSAT2_002394 [Lamellibrachia satsuma]|nr:hypothetical protein LSAT2_002394 [Lamellibrachia satsuma]